MRAAKLVMLGSLALVAVPPLAAKPPGLPQAPAVENRVPVYPDGEEFREPAPPRADAPETGPKPVRPKAADMWRYLNLSDLGPWHLLLPPPDL